MHYFFEIPPQSFKKVILIHQPKKFCIKKRIDSSQKLLMGKQVRARKEDERLSLRGRFKVVKIRRCCSDRHRPHSLGRGRHYWKENSLKICKSHPGKDLSRVEMGRQHETVVSLSGTLFVPRDLARSLGSFKELLRTSFETFPQPGAVSTMMIETSNSNQTSVIELLQQLVEARS